MAFSPLVLFENHVLAEVVVCAVGWVVTLPAMEMTAQATALLVLVPPLQPRDVKHRAAAAARDVFTV